MISASRSASAAGLRVVLADAFEQRCGPRRPRPGRRGRRPRSDSASRGLLGRGAERVGVAQPRLVGRELGVLAGLGVDRLDLAEAEPQQVGLPGPLAALATTSSSSRSVASSRACRAA